jgi:hypothetical protein
MVESEQKKEDLSLFAGRTHCGFSEPVVPGDSFVSPSLLRLILEAMMDHRSADMPSLPIVGHASPGDFNLSHHGVKGVRKCSPLMEKTLEL